MTATTRECIRCHPPAPDAPELTGAARFICDRCLDETRNPLLYRRQQDLLVPATRSPASRNRERSHADKPKRSRKRTGTIATGTAIILFLVASAVGCSFHRETSLKCGPLEHETSTDFICDPRSTVTPTETPQLELN